MRGSCPLAFLPVAKGTLGHLHEEGRPRRDRGSRGHGPSEPEGGVAQLRCGSAPPWTPALRSAPPTTPAPPTIRSRASAHPSAVDLGVLEGRGTGETEVRGWVGRAASRSVGEPVNKRLFRVDFATPSGNPFLQEAQPPHPGAPAPSCPAPPSRPPSCKDTSLSPPLSPQLPLGYGGVEK